MENKNVGLAFALVFALYLAYVIFFPSPPSPNSVQVQQQQQTLSGQKEILPPEDEKKTTTPTPTETVLGKAPAPKVIPAEFQNIVKRDLTVENDFFKAVLTNAGGKIKSFELKKFRATRDSDSPNVFLIDTDVEKMATFGTSGTEGFLFSSESFYKVSEKDDHIKLDAGEFRTVVFKTIQGNLLIEKIYTFFGDGYQFNLDLRLNNLGLNSVNGGVQIFLRQPWVDSGEKSSSFFGGGSSAHVGTATFVGEDLKTDSVEDLGEASVAYGGKIGWTSFEDKYFIKALVPIDEFEEQKVFLEKADNYVQNRFEIRNQSISPGNSLTFSFLGYFGPRDTDMLKGVGYKLENAVDFGFFEIIARPLLEVLKFFNSFVKNYGVSIIILTVLIKLLFWPLTQKSYTSMKAMQKVQPEMAKIRVKFKNDKARLNKEVMDLYRKHKVNPLGGCLPMVIQIPVFFALYKVLLEDIGLRHAPFMFWIQDLSAKDPYYITPVVMGITMFIQQKLTPTTMDSAQAKILNYMPLIFTFMFLNFPSGLVIYWLVNNLLTILQQYLIHRKTPTVEA